MKVNIFVKAWCNEDYDKNNEDFYTMNALWVIDRQWSKGCIAHGIVAGSLAAFILLLSLFDITQIGVAPFASALLLSILSVCFFFYGIGKYDGNGKVTAVLIYIALFVFLLLALINSGVVFPYIFAIAGTAFYVYLTFIRPSKFNSFKKKMALMTNEMTKEIENENQQADLKNYAQWAQKHEPVKEKNENQKVEIPPLDMNVEPSDADVELITGLSDSEE